MKLRVALYGGTFDPVHVGHLDVARRLQELFALDLVLFVPAHVAPHKRKSSVSPALHRYAMLALATQDDEHLRISTVELDAPEQPYTIETLERMQTALGDRAQLFFVMGADSWSEITTWHQWERVLSVCNHIVVTRPGYEIRTAQVGAAVRDRIIDMRDLPHPVSSVPRDDLSSPRIYLSDAVNADVSATRIRELARNRKRDELSSNVPPPVADYILKYELYKSE